MTDHKPESPPPGTAPAAPPSCPAWCTSKHTVDGDLGYRIHSAVFGRTAGGRADVAVRVYRVDSTVPGHPSRPAVVSVSHAYYGADAVKHRGLPDLTGDQARTLALVVETTGGTAEFATALRKAADILDQEQDDDGTEAGEDR